MRVLMLYHFSPHTTANYLARALVANGHDVRTSGTMASLEGFKQPCRLWGPHTYPVGDYEWLDPARLGDWKPDLILWVESGGLRGANWNMLNNTAPVAAWFIDSHCPEKFSWHKRIAPMFDYRFDAQRPWCEELGAHWLPLACDPEIHTPTQYSEEYDLAWVGGPWQKHPAYAKRFETMAKLDARYRCNFKSGVYFEDMANVYGSAKIGWHMSVTGRDLDMRVFEVMCSGRMLMADSAPESGLSDLFPGEGAPWRYSSEDTMFKGIDLWVGNGGVCDRFGAYGRELVLAAHTYRHRAHELMRVVGLE
jgi:hypothetical protein